MKEITLNSKNYLLVEVLKNRSKVRLWKDFSKGYLEVNLVYVGIKKNIYIVMDKNCSKIIGKVSDILKNEYICEGLVELANEQMVDVNNRKHYKDYKSASWELDYDKATDSFLSYLQLINLDLTKQFLLIKKL